MTQEQKQKIFDCIVMLKGSASANILNLPDDEILNILEDAASVAAVAAYYNIDTIEKLQKTIKDNY